MAGEVAPVPVSAGRGLRWTHKENLMAYDYDNAPTDPAHGGKLTAEMARERIAELEAALRATRDYLEDIGDHPEPGEAIERIDAVMGGSDERQIP